MTGQLKNCSFYRNQKIVEQDISGFSPYESKPSIGIDLLALTRYARTNNKKLEDMSNEEIAKFKKIKYFYLKYVIISS